MPRTEANVSIRSSALAICVNIRRIRAAVARSLSGSGAFYPGHLSQVQNTHMLAYIKSTSNVSYSQTEPAPGRRKHERLQYEVRIVTTTTTTTDEKNVIFREKFYRKWARKN